MTAYIFQKLAKVGKLEGRDRDVSTPEKSREWYRAIAQDVRGVNRNRMMNDKANIKQSIDHRAIGKMFAFFYDPKHKETLPYYDTFPLIFVVDLRADGFLGINLHYLPPVLRARLMDALYHTINNERYNDTTKLKISYNILSNASRYRYFKPCLKHYLAEHVVGNYLNIEPTNWDAALMLPTEQFKKANRETVWRESRSMV